VSGIFNGCGQSGYQRTGVINRILVGITYPIYRIHDIDNSSTGGNGGDLVGDIRPGHGLFFFCIFILRLCTGPIRHIEVAIPVRVNAQDTFLQWWVG